MHWSRSRPRPSTGPADVPRNRRQEETFRKVLAAGIEILREKSYADLTVRAVAARAKVAPATAYTYFSSKNHLIAEVYLDLVRQVPYFTDVNDPMPTRVDKVLRHLAPGGRRRTRGRAACTTALLGGGADPAVTAARDRIGAEIHRRITSAIGPDADPTHRVRARDGVLRRARPGRQRRIHLPRDRRPAGLCGAADPHRRGETSHEQRQELSDDRPRWRPRAGPRSLRLRLPRRSVPVLQAAARRGPAVSQRGTGLLGACRGTTTCSRDSATAPRCPTATASRWTRRRGDRTPPRPCRFWRWTIQPTCGCAPWCQKDSRPGGFASSSRASPRSRHSTSTPCWKRRRRAPSTTSTSSPASCPWTSSPS